ncbi:MAG TPA: hypothetical protein ENH94_04610 [Phycisphaerales bacterium]|nr:hypothetical protein [Phycisphaerales bacterium]
MRQENKTNLFVDQGAYFSSEVAISSKAIGMKAKGLFSLSHKWVPNFFVLSTELYERYLDLDTKKTFVSTHTDSQMLLFDDTPISPTQSFLDEALRPDEQECLIKNVQRISPLPEDYIIVRSSATNEDMNARGRHLSFICKATLKEISSHIIKIFEVCSQDQTNCPMSIIIQKLIGTTRSSGHLSNERRVTKRISSWLCEFDSLAGVGTSDFEVLSSRKTTPQPIDEFLFCHNMAECRLVLNNIASWASNKKLRLHFEWIWDGTQIWIVQADSAISLKGSEPYALSLKTLKTPTIKQLSTLVLEKDIKKGTWKKLDCLKTFRESNLKTATVWVLHDLNILMELSQRQWPEALAEDLQSLLTSPIVIRTDTSGENHSDKFMMPRTDMVSDYEEAKKFILNVASEYKKDFIDNNKPCFIFHRFIPARSSAFTYSQPNNPRIRIDGIWGSPDGLSYYPHDSFELSLSSNKFSQCIRYKEDYLDIDKDGRWSPRKAGERWDWKASLEKDEIKQISKGTYDIAKVVGKPVQVMWFVGIPDGLGHPDILPWYISTEATPDVVKDSPMRASLRSPLIRRLEDIDYLARTSEVFPVHSIRLRPIPNLLRSRDFIERVASLAKELNVSVELEGSILAHAFYLLRNFGIKVVCPGFLKPIYPPIIYNKLVRDNIPDNITQKGEKVIISKLESEELITELKAKVVEEALELYWSDTKDNTIEEIVDINEVLTTICKKMNLESTQIELLAKEKREKRGGFNKGYILKKTEEISIILTGKTRKTLFGEVGQEIEGTNKQAKHPKVLNSRSPKKDGPKLIIPMIPPDPSHRFESYPFQFPKYGVTMNIRFREKEIIIEIDEIKADNIRLLFD